MIETSVKHRKCRIPQLVVDIEYWKKKAEDKAIIWLTGQINQMEKRSGKLVKSEGRLGYSK